MNSSPITRRALLRLAIGAPIAAFSAALLPAPREGRASAAVLKVPLIKQPTDTSCGRAAVCMVLNYLSCCVSVDDPAVRAALPEWARPGVHLAPSFAKLSGTWEGELFLASRYDWLDHVREQILANRPLIALIPDASFLGIGYDRAHYVVVIGFDDAAERLAYADPWDGKYHVVSHAAFARAWGSMGARRDGWQPWIGVMVSPGDEAAAARAAWALPNGTFIRVPESAPVYVVIRGQRRVFPDWQTYR